MYVYQVNRERKAIRYMKDHGVIFINRYKYSHSSARKVLRKMLKQSKVELKHQDKDGFTYVLSEELINND